MYWFYNFFQSVFEFITFRSIPTIEISDDIENLLSENENNHLIDNNKIVR